jgi:SAM-dependent methyltransferase
MNERENTWDAYWQGEGDHSWWKDPAPEVMEFIASQSPDEHPDILDLGCGVGRHAIAFAQAGFSVTACDTSQEAISYLTKWADDLSLEITAVICDFLSGRLPDDTFDIVLAYNVIYHGFRNQFFDAVEHVHHILKRNGLFYFSCPTRDDGKYGFGQEVAPHTFMCEQSITPGDIHYFADEEDLNEMLSGFREIAREKREGYWDNRGTRQFYSNWHVLVRKE